MKIKENIFFQMLWYDSSFYSPYVYCSIITTINHMSSTRTKRNVADSRLTSGVNILLKNEIK